MHRQPLYIPVIQQRNELLNCILELFREMGYPITGINQAWTLEELIEHLDANHPVIAKQLLCLAFSAAALQIMRQAEAGNN